MTESVPIAGIHAPEEALEQLEYPKIVARLAGLTQTPYGYDLARRMAPMSHVGLIRQTLAETKELQAQLEHGNILPVGSGIDLKPFLDRLKTEGTRLDSRVLLEVRMAIEAARACRSSLINNQDCSALQHYAEGLVAVPELAEEIRRSIGPEGDVLDTASAELAALRRQLQQERSRVKRQLEKILADDFFEGVFQENLITDRNGRYVLPVRTDHSGRIKGFVQDISASGQTLYLEPESVLAGNNQIQRARREIDREIERVLARLTSEVRCFRAELIANQAILAQLDLRQATARLSQALGAEVPELVDQPLIELLDARHPLLMLQQLGALAETDAVVPIDILLPEDCQGLVVSGPNTGGKTVALKTAGLFVLMVRSGLPVPCAPGSRLFPFNPVLADIGDEQSIERSLSTFSGHLARLKVILERIGQNALVVLDELGTGTDPSEGAALALAALDLLKAAGARFMATTHLHMVKGYAELEEGVQNAAVEFDADSLEPTYRLHYGIPGASHAFTIARRLGLPQELLQRASDYLGHNEREGTAVIERLQVLRTALEEELISAGNLRRQAEQERDRRQKLREELEERRQAILDETRQEGSKLLENAEQKLHQLFREIRPEQTPYKDRASMTRTVRELQKGLPKASVRGPTTVPKEVSEREWLFIPALGVDAEVIGIQDDKVHLDAGGKRMSQPLSALRQYQPRRYANPTRSQPRIRDRVERRPFQPRLVLVGKRIDEACWLLEQFLDNAKLHDQNRLEVVHGSGQGHLRRAVRDLLANRPDVAGFGPAEAADGGDNVTVVEM